MSSLGSGTVKLMIGKVIAMAISFGTAPVVSRLFSPEDYGLAGLLQTMVMWMATFSCLGYAQAIPLSESSKETKLLIKLCLLITGVLAAVLLLVPTVLADTVIRLSRQPDLRRLLWFVPVLFGFSCVMQAGQYVLARQRLYGWLSAVNVVNPGTTRTIQIVLAAVYGGGAAYLITGAIAGTVAVVAVVFVLLASSFTRAAEPDESSELKTVWAVARRHRQFPMVQMWNIVLNTTSQALPIMLMGSLFSVAMVGHYHIGQRLITLPLMVLGGSLSQIFYPEAAEEWRSTGTASQSIFRSVRILSATCIFPLVAVGLLGPAFFELFLGEQWREAGVYAQMISPWMLIVLIASPLSTLFLIAGRPKLMLCYNVLLIVFRPMALIVGSMLESFGSISSILRAVMPEHHFAGAANRLAAAVGFAGGGQRIAILLYSAVGFVIQCHLLFTAIKIGGSSRRGLLALMGKEIAIALVLILPAALAERFAGTAACLSLLAVAGILRAVMLYFSEPWLKEKVDMARSRIAEVFH